MLGVYFPQHFHQFVHNMFLQLILVCVVFLISLSGLGLLALYAAPKTARFLVYGGCCVLCAFSGALGLWALVSDQGAENVVLPLGLPWLGAHFALDALSAFFVFVVGFGGCVASFYALGYGQHESAPARVLPFYPAFLAGMSLVILAADAFSFLVGWEFMSLASWALVVAHHKDPDNTRAGYIYIVMAAFGALALLLAFGLLSASGAGGYSFAAMRESTLAGWPALGLLSLVLLGAGSKAGIFPLHVWLPLAHPAAPSHVSALMSGVMTKVAVYGFMRIIFDLAGGGQTFGALGAMVVLLFGGVTAVMGVLYALMQHDLKRLLAYHTVENIGIIFIGLGLALAFSAQDLPILSALALTAALFHVFNHSLFKSLLFFGAGAVLTTTGTRDMERLGGLIHGMPRTTLMFLIGCIAISALPPLNGFVSEWLTFQAILQGPVLDNWGLRVAVPLSGAMLALAAALAAACFVKVFGVVFLGRARSEGAQQAKETERSCLIAMGLLALLCLLLGVVPGLMIDALAPITQSLVGGRLAPQMSDPWLSIVPLAQTHSAYNGLLVFSFIALVATFAAFVIHKVASAAVRRTQPWGCGFVCEDPHGNTQYTASSFAQPIRQVFGPYVFGAGQRVRMAPPGSLKPAHIAVRLRDVVWHELYMRLARDVLRVSVFLNPFQFLTIRRYLALVFITLICLLLGVLLWI